MVGLDDLETFFKPHDLKKSFSTRKAAKQEANRKVGAICKALHQRLKAHQLQEPIAN